MDLYLICNTSSPSEVISSEIDQKTVLKIVEELTSENRIFGLSWLENNLHKEMKDRENSSEEFEDIPLVPTSTDCFVALERQSFTNLLTLCWPL